MSPAQLGVAAEVPPTTSIFPSSTIATPVAGLASAATSGIPRLGRFRLVWYEGVTNSALSPPPLPYDHWIASSLLSSQ